VSNIPIGNALERVPQETVPKHRPALLSANLLQWRILFYVHNLQDWDSKGQIDTSNLYLQIKLQQSRTCWKINFPLTEKQKEEIKK
jgi:hypothetical protein